MPGAPVRPFVKRKDTVGRTNRTQPMTSTRRLIVGAVLVAWTALPAGASAGPTFDRLVENWTRLHDYTVTIEAHEVLGDRTADNVLRYAFRKPDRARLDVVAGTQNGSTMVWSGGERVVGYRRGMSLFKMHGELHDKMLTSLRGNDILSPNLGDIVDCFAKYRDRVEEREGPPVEGEPTAEVMLPYADVSCPDDPPVDKAVTLDVLDISKRTGLIVERKRFAGEQMVERWTLKDFKADSGLADTDLK